MQRYDLFSNCQIFFRIIFPGCLRMVCRTAVCTEKKFLTGPEKGPKNPAKKKKARHFSPILGCEWPIKNGMFAYFVVFLLFMAFSLCAYSVGLSSICLSHNVLQRQSIRDIPPYFFLRCLPHSYLFHAPPCPAARPRSTRPRPVHCSMRRQRIRTASIYYLYIEDSKSLISYNINIQITISKSQILNKKTMQNLPDTAWIQQR